MVYCTVMYPDSEMRWFASTKQVMSRPGFYDIGRFYHSCFSAEAFSTVPHSGLSGASL